MSVKVYEWGNLVGGSDSGGGTAPPAAASFGPVEDFAGILLAGATEVITFTASTKSVKIHNTHGAAAFTVSVDGGVTFRTFETDDQVEEPIAVLSITLVGGGSDSSYYVRGTLTE